MLGPNYLILVNFKKCDAFILNLLFFKSVLTIPLWLIIFSKFLVEIFKF